jgi:hypothetical protein
VTTVSCIISSELTPKLSGGTRHVDCNNTAMPPFAAAHGWVRSETLYFRSLRFRFLGRRMEEYALSDRQSTHVSDRAVDSRVVLVRTNNRL